MLCPTAKNTVDPHQQQPVCIALIWGMSSAVKACFFLLFTSGSSAVAPVADTVNERISVTGAELEAHWRVDCAGVSRLLRGLAGRSKVGVDCRLSPALRHQLQLCAFIYQAPGSDAGRACPDYRSALEVLDGNDPNDDCPRMAAFLPIPGHCPLTVKPD
tara:strand:+ start:195623 stop:196099 length:477 start_codon:yes stop_codon:yes gene_type:complete